MREVHQRVKLIEVVDSYAPDKFALAMFGKRGSGKTRFILTAPTGKHPKGGIGIIPLERKTKPTLLEANREFQKRLYFPETDLLRHAEPMRVAMLQPSCEKNVVIGAQPSYCCAIHYYQWHVKRIKDAIYTMVEDERIETIAIDSGSQLKEDLLMSHYGRTFRIMPIDRAPYNQDWKDILNSVQNKHLIITHHASEIWRNNKPTGTFDWDGYNKLDHAVDLIMETTFEKKNCTWHAECIVCRARPELIGKELPDEELVGERTNEDLTFQNIALSIYPESDPSTWE